MKTTLLSLVLSILCLTPQSAFAEPRQKIAILDISANTQLEEGVLKTLNEILLNEFHTSGKFDVLGGSDITSMLTLEEEKVKATGCNQDTCLVEIGGALGVPLMASASVGAIGDHYVVSAKVIYVEKATVLGRASETVPKNESELIAAIKRAVSKVIKDVVSRLNLGDIDIPMAKKKTKSPLTTWGWVTGGLGVALLASGAVTGGLAISLNNDLEGDCTGGVCPQALKDDMDRRDNLAMSTNILVGLGAAAVVAGVLMLTVFDTSDDISKDISLVPSVGPDFAGATILGRF